MSEWEACTCPVEGYSETCPMARGGLGHVKRCPAGRGACPCLPGSISEAHCVFEAADTQRFAGYEIRRTASDEGNYGRWIVHEAGRPNAVLRGYFTMGGARRAARRWARADERSRQSYPV